MDDNDQRMLDLARNAFPKAEKLTREVIDRTLDILEHSTARLGWHYDRPSVVRALEAEFAIFAPAPVILDDPESHQPWLPEHREEVSWEFWRKYKRHLLEQKRLPHRVVEGLDTQTDRILERIEWPARPGAWDVRGMVVGHVQSGKTANYAGLICKAADAGYRLIVVMAGLNNDLRAQTQRRLDEGFVGLDTQRHDVSRENNLRVGVGLLNPPQPQVVALTGSSEDGDFDRRMSRHGTVGFTAPVLLVVKKNGSILRNVISWISDLKGVDIQGKRCVQGIPLLLIDDESDNASVNTKDPSNPESFTAINGEIRRLLKLFEKSAYVAYTATPFANIFIPPDAAAITVGDDLFPRNFIVSLNAPNNYFGPVRVFGLDDNVEEAELPFHPALPVVREVDDWATWMPPRHRVTHVPTAVPASLRTALDSFVLTCAARAARGQVGRHNSMLVHVTRFKAVQEHVRERVDEMVTELRDELAFGRRAADSALARLETLWNGDFVETSRRMDQEPLAWDAVRPFIEGAVHHDRLRLKTVNGDAVDLLDYWQHPTGVNVIAIGGDKLSRGLTLEELSVSYFLRSATTYDALMQMGRWFGYRPGFEDLCRLFTTPDLIANLEHVTLAAEELRLEFLRMATRHLTPREYGLKVRTHPGTLTVTSANKLRGSTRMRVSYAGTISETVAFDLDPAKIAQNFRATVELIAAQGPAEPAAQSAGVRDDSRWQGVPAEAIIRFLDRLSTHQGSPRANSLLLGRYVEKRLAAGDLLEWNLVLRSKPGPNAVVSNIDIVPVGLLHRGGEVDESGTFSIKRLVDPPDERTGLSDHALAAALQATIQRWRADGREGAPPSKPAGPELRAQRSPKNGLLILYPLDAGLAPADSGTKLEQAVAAARSRAPDSILIGVAISFPGLASRDDGAIEYLVNEVYRRDELEDE